MIARFTTTPGTTEEDRQYIEIDVTEDEMNEIKKGNYPDQRIVVYKTDEKGNKIAESELVLTVSVGLLT